MTDEELKRIEARQGKWLPDGSAPWVNDVPALIAEVRRLRAVATKLNGYRVDQSIACPWCGADDDRPNPEPHKPDCLGFEPNGAVR